MLDDELLEGAKQEKQSENFLLTDLLKSTKTEGFKEGKLQKQQIKHLVQSYL